MVDDPLKHPTCGKVVCTECLCTKVHIENSSRSVCIVNIGHSQHLDLHVINTLTFMILPHQASSFTMLGNVCVVCSKCNNHTQLKVNVEHTAEGIHAYFDMLGGTYHGVPDRVERMKKQMIEHLLHVAQANIAAKLAEEAIYPMTPILLSHVSHNMYIL